MTVTAGRIRHARESAAFGGKRLAQKVVVFAAEHDWFEQPFAGANHAQRTA